MENPSEKPRYDCSHPKQPDCTACQMPIPSNASGGRFLSFQFVSARRECENVVSVASEMAAPACKCA